MSSKPRPLSGRFWTKVNKDGRTVRPELGPCWEWTGSTARGYGQIHVDGKLAKAHRVSWAMANAESPGESLVCHRCDNSLCVRPSHLFLGTKAENNADCRSKGRLAVGSRNGQSKLTENDVIDIRALRAVGVSARTLAGSYGLHETMIRKAANGSTWKHVDRALAIPTDGGKP